MKIARKLLLAGVALVFVAVPATAATRVVPPGELEQSVEIRNVTVHDGMVSGTVVNTTGRTLEHVRLVIDHHWRWRNEFHPERDNPGRADFYVLPSTIPPHGEVEFTYRPSEPLPVRSDGHFVTSVGVASVEQVG
ncbi:MAG TPA: hypothetical protein VKW76_08835 [Candidatus Binatia bacterium]|nr:hypothetical protein [Candidatus Binatia bacterium]